MEEKKESMGQEHKGVKEFTEEEALRTYFDSCNQFNQWKEKIGLTLIMIKKAMNLFHIRKSKEFKSKVVSDIVKYNNGSINIKELIDNVNKM